MNIKIFCLIIAITNQTIIASNLFTSPKTCTLTPQDAVIISKTFMLSKTIEDIYYGFARIKVLHENQVDYCIVSYNDGTTFRYKMYTHDTKERQEYYQKIMATTHEAIYKVKRSPRLKRPGLPR